MPIFSEKDHAFFRDNGYVIAHSVIPPENLRAVIDMIWEFLGMDPSDPEGWYRPPLSPGGMLEVYQHQALWDNRQSPRVHQAFSELFGTEKLWVSVDRANLKPPRHPGHPEYDHKGFIHWDTDTSKLPQPFCVQGVLALTDTTKEMGGFQGVPELFHDLASWLPRQPVDRNPFAPDLTGFEITPIPAQAGDLIVWNKLFPHGNGHNVSTQPRLAQYISMSPAHEDDEKRRQDRIMQWRDRLPPSYYWAPGDPRNWEREHGATAELTPLGRKLLGLDRWENNPST
jgi:hypothetical protein